MLREGVRERGPVERVRGGQVRLKLLYVCVFVLACVCLLACVCVKIDGACVYV